MGGLKGNDKRVGSWGKKKKVKVKKERVKVAEKKRRVRVGTFFFIAAFLDGLFEYFKVS